jgi:DNA invertase Pin-like site-specific DNA recombinase
MSTAKPRVFSYIRFSTPEQAMGVSEARQLDDAKKFAAERGLPFDETLADRGLSGLRGTHRKKGALGRFLQRVKAGDVPRGSILVVENVDRLGREGVWDMLKETIFTLVEHHVTLHFTGSRIEFDRGGLSDWRLQWLISEIQRAHAESKRKSELARDNWSRKQTAARPAADGEKSVLTGMTPAWLRWVGYEVVKGRKVGGDFEVIPEAAETVRLIYELKAQGLGYGTIERRLNAEARWTPPLKKGGGRPHDDGTPAVRQETAGWRVSYLKKILANRAVLGEYQPYREEDVEKGGERQLVRVPAGEVIPGYYPRVVDPDLFYAVQRQSEGNRRGGRTGKAKNLLPHLVKCAYCGGPMALIDRGAKGGRWLLCDNGRRGVKRADGSPACARHSMSYDEVEALLLDNCPHLRPEQVLPSPDEAAATSLALRRRIQGYEAELAAIEKQTDNLVDQIANTDDREMRARYEARAKALRERKAVIAADKAADERRLAESDRGLSSFAAWKKNLEELRTALRGGDLETRLRVRAHLRDLINRVEVFAAGFARRYDPLTDREGDDVESWPEDFKDMVRESEPAWKPDAEFAAFLE